MRVNCTEIIAYDIEVNGRELGLFRQTDTWNGFRKLQSLATNQFLIICPEAMYEGTACIFESLFSTILKDGPITKTFIVVCGSKDLLQLMGYNPPKEHNHD